MTWWGAEQAISVAGRVTQALVHSDGHDEPSGPEPAAWSGPAASSTSAPRDSGRTAAAGPGRTPTRRSSRPARVNGAGEMQTTREPGAGAPPQRGGDAPSARGTAPTAPAPAPEPAPDPEADAERAIQRGRAREPEPAPPPTVVPEPAHVSEEPQLVEEVADAGAEEGAGAQIRIGEPWEGYRQMKAAEIVDRLASASREELAAVELFELSGRNRKSVMAAAQRALRQASPPR